MRVLGFEDLKERGIPYSKSHLWRLERDGRFPKRVQLGPRTIAWVDYEIDAWIKDKCENNRFVKNDRLKSSR